MTEFQKAAKTTSSPDKLDGHELKASEEALNVFEMILIIDDDPITCFLQQNLIRDIGYKGPIQEAYHGEQALTLLKQLRSVENAAEHGPMLILLDINMPFVDGLDFLKELDMEQGINKDKLYIAILTTSISKRDFDIASKFSIVDFLVKPLSEQKIHQLLQSITFP